VTGDWRANLQQANRVVAAAVLVFLAQILLGSLLASSSDRLADRLLSSPRAAEVIAPLLHDFSKAICLLLICWPFGRVTAGRPWPTAAGLFGLVYLFDFGMAYAFGVHEVLFFYLRAALGRGLLLIGLFAAGVFLLERGRRAALRADRDVLPPPVAETDCKDGGTPRVPAGEHEGPRSE
jgi:hypothetical protein